MSSLRDPLVVSLAAEVRDSSASHTVRVTNRLLHALVTAKVTAICSGTPQRVKIGVLDLRAPALLGGGSDDASADGPVPRISVTRAMIAFSQPIVSGAALLPCDDAPFGLKPWQQLTADVVLSTGDATPTWYEYPMARMADVWQAPTVTLADCLRKFSQREQLDEDDKFRCPTCKEEVRKAAARQAARQGGPGGDRRRASPQLPP